MSAGGQEGGSPSLGAWPRAHPKTPALGSVQTSLISPKAGWPAWALARPCRERRLLCQALGPRTASPAGLNLAALWRVGGHALLEASPGPQWGRLRLQGVPLATESSKVAGPQLCQPSSAQPPTPSGPPLATKGLTQCHSPSGAAGVGPWASVTETVWGRLGPGICGWLQQGSSRLTSPPCPDLARLLWLPFPPTTSQDRLEPLLLSAQGRPPRPLCLSFWAVSSESPASSHPWNVRNSSSLPLKPLGRSASCPPCVLRMSAPCTHVVAAFPRHLLWHLGCFFSKSACFEVHLTHNYKVCVLDAV